MRFFIDTLVLSIVISIMLVVLKWCGVGNTGGEIQQPEPVVMEEPKVPPMNKEESDAIIDALKDFK
jgi:hypothetical protein